MSLKNATIKAGIVLIPSYTAAFLTEQMVYVVPMLAATSFFAGTVDLNQKTTRRRVDEDEADEGGGEDIGSAAETNQI
ncbi:hypothetical protein JAN5088_03552 [Jannaschia rubra]|uniref:Uncharacterized protein n=2 Tax=Jannaschia rubra TaxID=282197 RepID=A0A0M6XUD6_9RHOB|nr:hypothetical protein JAN5088_03552 [Jannaschia rubra]SFG68685.1 hypothetical protein SAMN04488517_1113 [Jannaschia rubra]